MACATARLAAGQDTVPEPYRGASSQEVSAGQRIELDWSVRGLRDEVPDAVAPAAGTDPLGQTASNSGAAAASFGYFGGGRRLSYGATASATAYYYPDFRGVSDGGASGAVAFGWKLGRNGKLSMSQQARWQPYYQLDFVAPIDSVQSLANARDVSVSRLESHGGDGNVEWSQKLGRRSSMTVDYAYRYTRWSISQGSFLWNAATARLKHGVTRTFGLHLGYGYGQVKDSLAGATPQVLADGRPPFVTNTADAGFDWTPGRTPARQTVVSVSAGAIQVSRQDERVYHPLADARVIQPLGAAVNARATYQRGVQFIEGFPGPLYADLAQVEVGWHATKWLEFSLGTDVSRGRIEGPIAIGQQYDAHSNTAGCRIALGRLLSLDAQYVRYDYAFDPTAVLPANVAHTLARQGLRVGLGGSVRLSRTRTPATTPPPAVPEPKFVRPVW